MIRSRAFCLLAFLLPILLVACGKKEAQEVAAPHSIGGSVLRGKVEQAAGVALPMEGNVFDFTLTCSPLYELTWSAITIPASDGRYTYENLGDNKAVLHFESVLGDQRGKLLLQFDSEERGSFDGHYLTIGGVVGEGTFSGTFELKTSSSCQ
ncbi:hypothetical protein JYU14_02575 [Simkania negevensis]|uniref:Lipoprotein n=1 Tax=Simkania negevensis TaxID=83561 RepID=A0ABS3AQD8_9BACT|nr:hypothetical protein [Simkania negevensis]